MSRAHKNECRGGARHVVTISKIATQILTGLVRFALVSDAVVPVVAAIALQAVFSGLVVLK